jgi:hypothetical protein
MERVLFSAFNRRTRIGTSQAGDASVEWWNKVLHYGDDKSD